MKDNISRQAVLEVVDKWWIAGTSLCSADRVISDIQALPSADRKGHWIVELSDKILGEHNWSCSECGEGFSLDIGKCPSDIGMNFCTNCGADMREEEK